MYHYQVDKHDHDDVIEQVWQFVHYIDERKEITITYYKMSDALVERRIQPLAILFSEYYFYLLAYEVKKSEIPKYFRIDWIVDTIVHRQRFTLPKTQKVKKGHLCKYMQYMFPGTYQTIRFAFDGPSLQAILDKIPVARIVKKEGNTTIIEAMV